MSEETDIDRVHVLLRLGFGNKSIEEMAELAGLTVEKTREIMLQVGQGRIAVGEGDGVTHEWTPKPENVVDR